VINDFAILQSIRDVRASLQATGAVGTKLVRRLRQMSWAATRRHS